MSIEIKQTIRGKICAFQNGSATENALSLFQSLGYNTDRQAALSKKNWADFKDSYLTSDSPFNEEKAQVSSWKYIDLLFQLSKEEMSQQNSLFDTGKVDNTIIESYLFFVLELKPGSYSRTVLSQITREINKIFSMPVFVLFKIDNHLTFSIINRRLHKKDQSKDVLLKVTLIKDIDITNPHRAHVEILFDLSLPELQRKLAVKNFVELHGAWQKTLDTKELNKKFYRELSCWYFWAMENVSFPADVIKDEKIRNATNLIRLITRVIFIWFIKEKNLVPDALFDIREIKETIKDFLKTKKSNNYYTAILQNLFFGTLNQKMSERKFAKDSTLEINKKEYGVKTLFRYGDLFLISEKEAVKLFAGIPFLNGGLFDCLDKEDNNGKVVYGDGFSRNPRKQTKVPDDLFFGDERIVDLSDVFGDSKRSKEKVRGLFHILNAYKFTIAENTPVEEEIALDPELLGRVFENLLASYNPETKTTARKQTGSFYTPREIVDYMVDESLKIELRDKLVTETEMDKDDADVALDLLFEYNEKEHLFDSKQTDVLIKAIDNLKIIDPACGSGAFPMGVLHKMVHILEKLDPKNEKWKNRQIEKLDIDIPELREKFIADIEEAFEKNEIGYARKLFLIENCIYGVDIQPIAVQIAKLRFFISLIVDQRKQDGKENLGVRSLPNLETKFVAADSLIALPKPKEGEIAAGDLFANQEIPILEKKLKDLRHRYFSAKTRKEKIECQKADKKLREQIAAALEESGWEPDVAKKIVAFDPYDQNMSATFFDQEWMFGLRQGFDIVIGNPPYVQIQNFSGQQVQKDWEAQNYKTFTKTGDVYCLFYERGFRLLNEGGTLAYITSNKWMRANYGKAMRKYFLNNGSVLQLIDFGDSQIFENATTYTNIMLWVNGKIKEKPKSWDVNRVYKKNTSLNEMLDKQDADEGLFKEESFVIVKSDLAKLKKKIEEVGTPLKDWDISIYRGILTGLNEAFIISGKKKDELINEDPKSAEIIKPILRGRDIKRYKAEFADLWLIATFPALQLDIENYPAIKKHLKSFGKRLEQSGEKGSRKKTHNKWFEVQDSIGYYKEFQKNKLLYAEIVYDSAFYFDKNNFYPEATTFILTGERIKFLVGFLNSKLLTYSFKTFYAGGDLRGNTFRYKKAFLENLPIPKIDDNAQLPFEILVDCILFAKEKNLDMESQLFESVIDGMVFDLYFPEEMKAAHCYITDRVAEVIKPFKPDDTEAFKKEYIEELYKFFNKDKIIYHGLIHRRTVKPVEIITGANNER